MGQYDTYETRSSAIWMNDVYRHIDVTHWSFTFVTLSWVLFVSKLHFMCLFAVSLCQCANYFKTLLECYNLKVIKVIC